MYILMTLGNEVAQDAVNASVRRLHIGGISAVAASL
jgi:hypothetical protein